MLSPCAPVPAWPWPSCSWRGARQRSPTTTCAPHPRNRRSRSRRPLRRPSTSRPSPRGSTTPGTSSRRRTARCWSTSGPVGSPRCSRTARCGRSVPTSGTCSRGARPASWGWPSTRGSPATAASTAARASRPADDASIAVVAWTVAADWGSADAGGRPAHRWASRSTSGSGRHGGCRLRFDEQGALLIGTGDNAVGSNPQDPRSWAGKVLLADAATGEVAVWTLGHRNVQGLAVRPGTGQVFSVEHGPDRDDEVNLLREGANYGWDPDGGAGGYDESVPMTDPDIPGAVPAVWSSGDSDHRGQRRDVPGRRAVGRLRRAARRGCAQGPGRPGAAAGRRRRPAGAVPAARAGGPLRPPPERAPGRGRCSLRDHRQRLRVGSCTPCDSARLIRN